MFNRRYYCWWYFVRNGSLLQLLKAHTWVFCMSSANWTILKSRAPIIMATEFRCSPAAPCTVLTVVSTWVYTGLLPTVNLNTRRRTVLHGRWVLAMGFQHVLYTCNSIDFDESIIIAACQFSNTPFDQSVLPLQFDMANWWWWWWWRRTWLLGSCVNAAIYKILAASTLQLERSPIVL